MGAAYVFEREWLRMSRMMVVLIVVLLVLVGGTIFLSTRAQEKQPTRMEKAVSLGNLAG